MVYHHIIFIEEYLLCYGMDKKYTCWIQHGKGDPNEVMHDNDDTEDDSDAAEPVKHGGIKELLDDLHQDVCSNVHMSTNVSEGNSDHEHNIRLKVEETSEQFVKLIRDASELLYLNCVKFFKLEFLIKLFYIKIMNRWSQKLFDQNFILIKVALPDGEKLSKSYSEEKIYMRKLRHGYISIHVYKNDYILFYKDNEQITECPKYSEPRYKTDNRKEKKISQKIFY